MELIRRVQLMREISREVRSRGKKIAFVPTMGSLHDGHLSLVRRARELGDVVVVSVFVNPKQFGPTEDFQRYPRDIARDADLCIQEGVDYLFAPEAADVYPVGFRTVVEVEGISDVLEGASRPGHFRGVCTVVLKLLNIVRPHFAVFGQKDAQQALIVRRMIQELNLDVEPVISPTIRHEDGLALSSRNALLTANQRSQAGALHRALSRARELVEEEGVQDAARVEAGVRQVLASEPGVRVDYVAVVDTEHFSPIEWLEGSTLIALAAWVGEVRLIDNVIVEPKRSAAAASAGEKGESR